MSREAYSELMKAIRSGRFVYTGEIEPVKTTSLEEVLTTAKLLKGYVAAVNITDNPTAFAYMNALIPSYFIQKEVGLEAVYQVTVRDRNRLAITADLLAAGALGIKNVLALSGDHTTVGDDPRAKPVYDIDSTNLVELLSRMVDDGTDLKGNKIDHPPKFNIGVAGNPNADPLEPEIMKIERKVCLGADFIQTQAVYDLELAKRFLEETSKFNVPVIIGIAPFKSMSMMEWMVKNVPGIVVPEELQSRLKSAREKGGKEAFLNENIEIFGELVKNLKSMPGVRGIHIMTIGFEWVVPKIIERANL
ncbi:MAG: methylenetetrahydrofolate reductase [Candidatus Bathyarchaeia archaeon]